MPVTRPKKTVHTSRCTGLETPLRGHAGQIAEKYEDLAKQAEKDGDWMLAETYYQHAHHWGSV